ncbi:MAG TPA: cupin domain-containing protein [Thermoanaerobaculia bacterium]|nr:cupin domain-containing protein [Thermoanaerobaculia bacterium]
MTTKTETAVVDLAAKLAAFSEHWSPRVVGELNGQQVKLAKLLGEFDWHHHEHEDELFLVLSGELLMRLRGDEGPREVTIGEGQFFIVPRGVEHQPVAHQECSVMLFEPASTLNTGNLRNERTVERLARL